MRKTLTLVILCVLIATAVGAVTYRVLHDALQEITELRAALAAMQQELDTLRPTEAVGGAEALHEDPAMDGDMIRMPVAEEDFLTLTSPYGHRVSPFFAMDVKHVGVDIATVWRAQVVSVADGVVVEHWPAPGTPVPDRPGVTFTGHPVYGAMVIVEHDNGIRSLYAHMDSTRVHTGQRVAAGHVIGRVGDTGMARGNHLHFELSIDGEHVNPLLYMPPDMAHIAMNGR